MDVVSRIKDDHRLLEGLFERMRSRQGDITAMLDEVRIRLTAHSRAEEDHVYPALIVQEPEESGEVYHGYSEHHEAEAMLYRLKSMPPESAEFGTTLEEFINAVQHHIEEEESEILPALTEAVDKKRLTELGDVFERQRMQELRAHDMDGLAAAAGTPPLADGRGRTGAMSREELYAKAKEAQVPGRSQMSKEELAEAVARAPPPRRPLRRTGHGRRAESAGTRCQGRGGRRHGKRRHESCRPVEQ
jgi:hemerythrin superfamily protein